MNYFYLHIWRGVEPAISRAYRTAALRDRAARRLAQRQDCIQDDFFKMSIHWRRGLVELDFFTSDELGRDQ